MPVDATRGILQNADPAAWGEHRFGLPRRRWERLAGKSFWITGAGTGYGRSIAVALLAAGAQVFITGRRADKLQATIDEGLSLGINIGRCVPLPADITAEADLARAAAAISRYVPHLYGLVNSAALAQPDAGPHPLTGMGVAAWTGILTTNVTGQWLACRAALPLLENGSGFRILFLSSEAGWAATPGVGPYNISKSAVNTLGASLAAECARKLPGKDVQINVLVPGEARTEMNAGSTASPYAAVGMTLTLLSHPPGGPNGGFFHRDGRHLAFAYSPQFAADLLAADD